MRVQWKTHLLLYFCTNLEKSIKLCFFLVSLWKQTMTCGVQVEGEEEKGTEIVMCQWMSENMTRSLRPRANSVFGGLRCPFFVSAVAYVSHPTTACHREKLILFLFPELWPYSITNVKPMQQRVDKCVSSLCVDVIHEEETEHCGTYRDIWKAGRSFHQKLEELWSRTDDGGKREHWKQKTFLL